jgi:hypothetical protein
LGYPNNTACEQEAVDAINNGRASEGLPPLSLPSNFYSLAAPDQLLVLIDEERVSRGLTPVYGLVDNLNTDAEQGAQANQDPSPYVFSPSEPYTYEAASNWAEDYSTAGSVYDWMYNDGWGPNGSNNVDCTSPTAAGCWGHRDNILLNSGSGYVPVMGAASIPESQLGQSGSPFESDTLVITFVPSSDLNQLRFTYTWSQATADGANPAT